MHQKQIAELLLQTLETELGGVELYTEALQWARNNELKQEWHKYREQTARHVEVVRVLCRQLGVDPEAQTPARQVVHHIGTSLVEAIEMAARHGEPQAAELVACECVMLAEKKDHANWELLSRCADHAKGEEAKALKTACAEVEKQENEHLCRTKAWCRELWIRALGMPAVLPPQENNTKTSVGALRAEESRADGQPKPWT
jgi:rubrerythrin